MSSLSIAAAVSRVADAIFACAKEQRKQVDLQKRSIDIAEQMLEMQKVNLAVSKHLEAELAMRAGGSSYAGAAN